ncbi:MAG TPA: ATPase, T2SS/T4P/T4SS family [Nitriliruptorales bacterium]|nr:ATPase, T2SS/T4P/T4SS family [Nitriliruptorales bacterium]
MSGAGTAAPPVDAALREAVAARVVEEVAVAGAPPDRSALRVAVARALAAEGVVVSPTRWARLVRDLVDELGGLGPLEALLRDPTVTDVMVNGPADVWVERGGALERTDVTFADEAHVVAMLGRVLGPLGVRLDRGHPWTDAVLPGGVRLHALLPPLAPAPTVTLRRVPPVVPSWDDLAASGAVPVDAAATVRAAVRDRRNLVVCGRAGVGKTTLLSRLLADVGGDRVILIEDAPELTAPAAHVVPLQVRPPSPDGAGGVDVATLVRNALRMRPDRLVVGEVRGHEVADVLQAMNTGHAGSMCTVHANGATDALVRLEGMALLAGVPAAAARAQLATAVDLVLWMDRDAAGGRRLAEVVAVDAVRGLPRPRTIWAHPGGDPLSGAPQQSREGGCPEPRASTTTQVDA